MKIVVSTNNIKHPINGDTDALGGAWLVAQRICRELASFGHKVYHFCITDNQDSQGTVVDGFKIVHRKWMKEFIANSHIDVYIGERDIDIDRHQYDIKVVCYHGHNTPIAEKPEFLNKWAKSGSMDMALFVSDWMKNLCKQFPEDLIYVLRNGCDDYEVTGRKKTNRLVWASNPSRGLSMVANEIFPKLKKKIKNLELHVAGSQSIYNFTPEEAEQRDKMFYSCLFKDNKYDTDLKEGVYWYRALGQKEMAQMFHEGTLLLFPLTNRSETGSLVTVMSLFYKTPAIVLNRAVLPELVGKDRGIILDDTDVDLWVDETYKLLKNKERYKKMQKACEKWRGKYLWKNIIAEFNQALIRWVSNAEKVNK